MQGSVLLLSFELFIQVRHESGWIWLRSHLESKKLWLNILHVQSSIIAIVPAITNIWRRPILITGISISVVPIPITAWWSLLGAIVVSARLLLWWTRVSAISLLRWWRTTAVTVLRSWWWPIISWWRRRMAIELTSVRRRRSSSPEGRGRTKAWLDMGGEWIGPVISIVNLTPSTSAPTSSKWCAAVRAARMGCTSLSSLNVLAIERWGLELDTTK